MEKYEYLQKMNLDPPMGLVLSYFLWWWWLVLRVNTEPFAF